MSSKSEATERAPLKPVDANASENLEVSKSQSKLTDVSEHDTIQPMQDKPTSRKRSHSEVDWDEEKIIFLQKSLVKHYQKRDSEKFKHR